MHIHALVATLSDDERLALEYERNCNAHIFQTGYRMRVKVKDDNTVTKPREFKGKPISEVNASVERVLSQYKFVDNDFLKALLKRFGPHLTQIGIGMARVSR